MATVTAEERVRFERLTSHIGAMVHGFDLDTQPQPLLSQLLNEALHEYGVLLFQFDDVPSADRFVVLSSHFGELDSKDRQAVDEGREPCLDDAATPMAKYQNNRWHSNSASLECPPRATLLTPLALPDLGGDTMWADMHAAWEALSPHYQRLLEDAEIVNGTLRKSPTAVTPKTIHPAMLRDPVTGRKLLFVNSNYAEAVVGMNALESENLLQMLFAHVNTPEFHFRVKWCPGLIAVWDERRTQHRGVADFTGPRKFRRLSLKGDRPTR